MEVRALEDGDINDTINVRAKNGKNLKAFVASKERVEIR
jgi:flagella basal body P-ring formation protein FlgA